MEIERSEEPEHHKRDILHVRHLMANQGMPSKAMIYITYLSCNPTMVEALNLAYKVILS